MSPWTHQETLDKLSGSRHATPSSPMLSVGISMPSELATILDHLERSVSLDEKITLMGEFISMLSLCGTKSISQEMSVYSMWTDATQMYSLAGEHRKRCTIMLRRMETLSQEDWKGRAERSFISLARRGLASSWQRLETSFLSLCRNWILGHFALASDLFELMPIGDTENLVIHTSLPQDFFSIRQTTRNLMTGYNELWCEMRILVSHVFSSCLASLGFQK